MVEHNRRYRNGPLSGIALVGDSNDNRVAHNEVRDHDVLKHTPDGRPTTCGSRSAIAGIAVHSYNTQAGTPPNTATVIRGNRVSETGRTTHEMDPHAHGITVMRMGPPSSARPTASPSRGTPPRTTTGTASPSPATSRGGTRFVTTS